MRTSIAFMCLGIVASSCSADPSSDARSDGGSPPVESLSVDEDAFIESIALTFVLADRERGVRFLDASEYRCVFGRLVDEFGLDTTSDVFGSAIGPEPAPEATTDIGLAFLDAYYDCVDHQKFTDRMVEALAQKGLDRAREVGEDRATPESYACASRLVVDEFGPRAITDLLTGALGGAEMPSFDDAAESLSRGLASCVDLEEMAGPPTTTVVPASESTTPERDSAEILAEMRSGLIDILMERDGLSRADAEAEADERMEQGVDSRIVEDMFAIHKDWMETYQDHPMFGDQWTDDEARCVILAMMDMNGIYGTEQLINRATRGGMTDQEALGIVEPVAKCVDLRALTISDMHAAGLDQDPDCLMAGVTGEDVARWHIADFTEGLEGFTAAFLADLDRSCPTSS